jgi:hypothetical protein
MPTIDKLAREIRDFEGFDVRIRRAATKGNERGTTLNVPGYKRRYNRIAWNTFTVNDWTTSLTSSSPTAASQRERRGLRNFARCMSARRISAVVTG